MLTTKTDIANERVPGDVWPLQQKHEWVIYGVAELARERQHRVALRQRLVDRAGPPGIFDFHDPGPASRWRIMQHLETKRERKELPEHGPLTCF
jgi:hypothetical protein